MKILLGKMFCLESEPITAIEIEGMDVIPFEHEENSFEFINLTKKQLWQLKALIDKELEYDEWKERRYLERHQRCASG